MDYYWIDTIEHFQHIAREWDEAVFLSGEDNPFLLSNFIEIWWKHYSAGQKLQIFVICENRKIVGGLPLCRHKNGYLKYIGGIAANYTEFLSYKNADLFWEALSRALSERKDWRCAQLKRIRKSKLRIKELRLSSFSNRNAFLLDVYSSDWTYAIRIPKDFTGYFNSLHHKLRYFVRKSERELAKLGIVTLSSLSGHDEVMQLADTYLKLSRASFKERNRQSAFENKRYADFFTELVSSFWRAGYLDANVLRLDGKSIAIHFGYSIGNNLNYVFPVFDIRFAKLRPGHLMMYKLVELGSRRGNAVVDMYPGELFYKRLWGNYTEEVFSVEIRRSTMSNRIERALLRKVRSISKSNIFKQANPAATVITRIVRAMRTLTRNLIKEYI